MFHRHEGAPLRMRVAFLLATTILAGCLPALRFRAYPVTPEAALADIEEDDRIRLHAPGHGLLEGRYAASFDRGIAIEADSQFFHVVGADSIWVRIEPAPVATAAAGGALVGIALAQLAGRDSDRDIDAMEGLFMAGGAGLVTLLNARRRWRLVFAATTHRDAIVTRCNGETVEIRRRGSTRRDVAGAFAFFGGLVGLLSGGLSYGDAPPDDGGARMVGGAVAGAAAGALVGYAIGSAVESETVSRRRACPASSSAPSPPAPPGHPPP